MVLHRYANIYDVFGIESSIPAIFHTDSKGLPKDLTETFEWSDDAFPPHMSVIPPGEGATELEIFDPAAFIKIGQIIRNALEDLEVDPDLENAISLTDLDALNFKLQADTAEGTGGPFKADNVGHREQRDWYSDAQFGKQQFAGTSPATIKTLPQDLLAELSEVANSQHVPVGADLIKLLADGKDLYVQDYRYFREAIKVAADADMSTQGESGTRWACAAVSIFHLQPNGKLHPLAIVIDYKKSMKESVVIFNKRSNATENGEAHPDETSDWPWRYAKSCAQVSDWIRHQLGEHLTSTHLIEEAIIVATRRSFQSDHIIHQLLDSHWFRTLSLNASARTVLLPMVIMQIVGFTQQQGVDFIGDSYKRFDWQGSYVPKDLETRGFANIPKAFDPEAANSKFRNYTYARNIEPLWHIIRSFVNTSLKGHYENDQAVKNEERIKTWCREVRVHGKIESFPATIETIDQLVDAVTMCIHIASPQHTAINYLQQYYLTFIPNKPSALCKALPKTGAELSRYTERDLMEALPLLRPREWLLASHVPWLLNFQAESKYTLLAYAQSQALLSGDEHIRNAAKTLYENLTVFPAIIEDINKYADEKKHPYVVLKPEVTAVSILI